MKRCGWRTARRHHLCGQWRSRSELRLCVSRRSPARRAGGHELNLLGRSFQGQCSFYHDNLAAHTICNKLLLFLQKKVVQETRPDLQKATKERYKSLNFREMAGHHAVQGCSNGSTKYLEYIGPPASKACTRNTTRSILLLVFSSY
jgi:hypothetical protein